MRVVCPTCSVEIPEGKLDFAQLLAACSCGNVFALTDGLVDRSLPGSPSGGSRPPLALPEGMTREKVAPAGGYRSADRVGALRLTRRTVGKGTVTGLIAFGLLPPAIAAYLLTRSADGPSLGIAAFMLFISGVAVWTLLARLLNTTTLDVDRQRIRVRTGPVPTWGENVDLATPDLEQLIVTHRRSDDTVTYSVVARMRTGLFVPVIRDIPSQAQAAYIEREIEELLGIEDEDPARALIDPPRALIDPPRASTGLRVDAPSVTPSPSANESEELLSEDEAESGATRRSTARR